MLLLLAVFLSSPLLHQSSQLNFKLYFFHSIPLKFLLHSSCSPAFTYKIHFMFLFFFSRTLQIFLINNFYQCKKIEIHYLRLKNSFSSTVFVIQLGSWRPGCRKKFILPKDFKAFNSKIVFFYFFFF